MANAAYTASWSSHGLPSIEFSQDAFVPITSSGSAITLRRYARRRVCRSCRSKDHCAKFGKCSWTMQSSVDICLHVVQAPGILAIANVQKELAVDLKVHDDFGSGVVVRPIASVGCVGKAHSHQLGCFDAAA